MDIKRIGVPKKNQEQRIPSTLNNATLPVAMRFANPGATRAMTEDRYLATGLNVADGKIRHKAVADALNLPFAG